MTWKSSLKDSISKFIILKTKGTQPSQNRTSEKKKKKTLETEREKIKIGVGEPVRCDPGRPSPRDPGRVPCATQAVHGVWPASRTVRDPCRYGARPSARRCESQVTRNPGLLQLLFDLILLSPSNLSLLSPSDLLLDFLNFFWVFRLVPETVRLRIFSNFFGL